MALAVRFRVLPSFGDLPMKTVLMLGVSCLLLASAASAAPATAQQNDASPLIQQVQDRGGGFDRSDRNWSGRDRDRDQRRWSRDDDDDNDPSFGRGPGGSAMGLGMGGRGGGQNRAMMMQQMHKHMMEHAGGARFHLRRGDSEISVRCPTDTQLNDCIDAIGRVLDRLNSSGLGGAGTSGSTGSGTGTTR